VLRAQASSSVRCPRPLWRAGGSSWAPAALAWPFGPRSPLAACASPHILRGRGAVASRRSPVLAAPVPGDCCSRCSLAVFRLPVGPPPLRRFHLAPVRPFQYRPGRCWFLPGFACALDPGFGLGRRPASWVMPVRRARAARVPHRSPGRGCSPWPCPFRRGPPTRRPGPRCSWAPCTRAVLLAAPRGFIAHGGSAGPRPGDPVRQLRAASPSRRGRVGGPWARCCAWLGLAALPGFASVAPGHSDLSPRLGGLPCLLPVSSSSGARRAGPAGAGPNPALRPTPSPLAAPLLRSGAGLWALCLAALGRLRHPFCARCGPPRPPALARLASSRGPSLPLSCLRPPPWYSLLSWVESWALTPFPRRHAPACVAVLPPLAVLLAYRRAPRWPAVAAWGARGGRPWCPCVCLPTLRGGRRARFAAAGHKAFSRDRVPPAYPPGPFAPRSVCSRRFAACWHIWSAAGWALEGLPALVQLFAAPPLSPVVMAAASPSPFAWPSLRALPWAAARSSFCLRCSRRRSGLGARGCRRAAACVARGSACPVSVRPVVLVASGSPLLASQVVTQIRLPSSRCCGLATPGALSSRPRCSAPHAWQRREPGGTALPSVMCFPPACARLAVLCSSSFARGLLARWHPSPPPPPEACWCRGAWPRWSGREPPAALLRPLFRRGSRGPAAGHARRCGWLGFVAFAGSPSVRFCPRAWSVAQGAGAAPLWLLRAGCFLVAWVWVFPALPLPSPPVCSSVVLAAAAGLALLCRGTGVRCFKSRAPPARRHPRWLPRSTPPPSADPLPPRSFFPLRGWPGPACAAPPLRSPVVRAGWPGWTPPGRPAPPAPHAACAAPAPPARGLRRAAATASRPATVPTTPPRSCSVACSGSRRAARSAVVRRRSSAAPAAIRPRPCSTAAAWGAGFVVGGPRGVWSPVGPRTHPSPGGWSAGPVRASLRLRLLPSGSLAGGGWSAAAVVLRLLGVGGVRSCRLPRYVAPAGLSFTAAGSGWPVCPEGPGSPRRRAGCAAQNWAAFTCFAPPAPGLIAGHLPGAPVPRLAVRICATDWQRGRGRASASRRARSWCGCVSPLWAPMWGALRGGPRAPPLLRRPRVVAHRDLLSKGAGAAVLVVLASLGSPRRFRAGCAKLFTASGRARCGPQPVPHCSRVPSSLELVNCLQPSARWPRPRAYAVRKA